MLKMGSKKKPVKRNLGREKASDGKRKNGGIRQIIHDESQLAGVQRQKKGRKGREGGTV